MIEKLLDAAIRFRWGVVILTLIISAYGLTQLLLSLIHISEPTRPY